MATLCNKFQLHPVQLGNMSLMFEFSKHFSGSDLSALNIVCQHKKVIHLSCIVLCNGQTINKDYLTPGEGCSDYHKFPMQHLSCADHSLWITAIQKISFSYLVLPFALGQFLSHPHMTYKWTTNMNGTVLQLEMITKDITRYLIYIPTHATRTHAGQRFDQSDTFSMSPLPYYASVTHPLDTSVFLHSWIKQFVPQNTPTSFWENIGSMNNPSLWRNLQCDGDGTWVYDSLQMGSLIVIHNGSYMKEVSTFISSATVMILCIAACSICKRTIAEH
jgi:hypothetical protein